MSELTEILINLEKKYSENKIDRAVRQILSKYEHKNLTVITSKNDKYPISKAKNYLLNTD